MKRDNIIVVIIILALIMYLFGFEISHLIHNSEGLIGEQRKSVIKQFWILRFSLYSVIIMLLSFAGRYYSYGVGKMWFSIIFNLSFISVIDKFIFTQYNIGRYDSIIIIIIILIEFIRYEIHKSKKLQR